MAEPDQALDKQGICRGRKKTHDKDQCVARVLFREWSEKITEFDGNKMSGIPRYVLVLSFRSKVARRFGAKRWHKKRKA